MSGRKPTSRSTEQSIIGVHGGNAGAIHQRRCRFCSWVSPKRKRRAKAEELFHLHLMAAHPDRSLPAEDAGEEPSGAA
jgi:hypothetical protein